MVVTILNNGKLVKQQTLVTENSKKFLVGKNVGDLTDYTDSSSSFGVTQKKAPTIEYDPEKDWTETFWFKDFSVAKKKSFLKKK